MRRKMKKGAQVQAPTIERNVTPPPTPCGNMPLIQEPVGGTVMLPNTSSFTVVGNGMPMGLAQYSQVDEYGRVFTPIMSYGPLPNSSPVPIARPAKIVQLTPVVTPLALVPYATQNQELYQYDEE
ncbi:MAG: hypothetical protein ACOYIQ_01150 [Christensenellales bacterium]|jgi:hypothetical protein